MELRRGMFSFRFEGEERAEFPHPGRQVALEQAQGSKALSYHGVFYENSRHEKWRRRRQARRRGITKSRAKYAYPVSLS
jgi:hypothetical protein